MRLNRRTRIQLALFTVIALVSGSIMLFRYIDAPAMLFGAGRYDVTLQLPRAGGLYYHGNVTYRGTEVGRIETVRLTPTGAEAVLSLTSGVDIPSDLSAEVHSASAVGEQYVELVPRSADGPPLKAGDVIAAGDAVLPPDFDTLLDATNRGLQAIPQADLKTVIDESYTAVGGLGPELTRLVNGSTTLALDADKNLDPLTTVIDKAPAVLDSQADSAGAIKAWAAHLAAITGELRDHNKDLIGVLKQGGPALGQLRDVMDRLHPTVPLLMANLVSIADVAIVYQPALEQMLVLLPQLVANEQGALVANLNTKQDYKGFYLDFKLNVNLPPPCSTGYLPPQQQRVGAPQDYPDRPTGDLYCRTPQDGPFNVRGAKNYPCLTVPGKRAPTVKMCESSDEFLPINDGNNWKGDPNATTSGQGVPQLPPGGPPMPIAAAHYDPATGNYVGPDGRLYSQSNLSQTLPKEQTWQSMLIPPS